MPYRSLEDALKELKKNNLLISIQEEVDPYLEMAAIARQAYAQKSPAILFENVKGSPFRAVCNLFGSEERIQILFKKKLKLLKHAIDFKSNPLQSLKKPSSLFRLPFAALHALPRFSLFNPVLFKECRLTDIPLLHSWPKDGGAFITLPQVCSLSPDTPSILKTNIGMYRIQITGNDYEKDQECGLHYQINRDIAKHHEKAIQLNKPLKVSIFIGGPPAHTVAAVMPMPENLSELFMAGLLNGRAFRYSKYKDWIISSEADFCILGEIDPHLKEEGPFGDHLGYYSGKHPFPFIKIHKVFHRKNAIYPFTVVGRPPQEDTQFGALIHQITAPMVPASVANLIEMHAVDAAGVHPLLLAIGNESFLPYEAREPMQLLKIANAILGFNQAALAKYLWIAAIQDDSQLSTSKIASFFEHCLSRIDFSRDLHFQTSTTIDTLDYTGTSLNHGSKLVLAAAGKVKRQLGKGEFLEDFPLIEDFSKAYWVMPGVLCVTASQDASMDLFLESLSTWEHRELYPWISLVDDAVFASKNLDNWLWVTFTRSDPAQDVYGIHSKIHQKHYACEAPLVVDARSKKHHQEALIENPIIEAKAKEKLANATFNFSL
ncbi:MAG: UbiD family decarboxylase [Fibrobacter sp.]|nr:UbiD family decarboxylase [Fibrobacter sp.]